MTMDSKEPKQDEYRWTIAQFNDTCDQCGQRIGKGEKILYFNYTYRVLCDKDGKEFESNETRSYSI